MSEITAVPLQPVARSTLVKLWLGVGVLLAVGVGAAWAGTERQVRLAMPPSAFLAANGRKSGVETTASGLEYQVIREGAGARPTAQDMVLVDYEGRLLDGKIFDASARHGGPTPLPVGQMVPGFSEALQLMNKGAKYRFWIKPELAYGPQAMPDPRTGEEVIPANALLVFDIDMHEIMPAPPGGMGGLGAMGGHGDMGAGAAH